MACDILVVPDSHANPFDKNDRYDLLGRFILDRKPEVVVDIGDWADMPSLSSYDKGKRSFEGRRYKEDIASCVDAHERTWAPTKEYNDRAKKNRDKQYRPKKISTEGNHNYRITRLTELHPELHGSISTADLQFEKYGWTVYPYEQPVTINGIVFCHTLPTGVSGQPISGQSIAKTLIQKNHVSCVVGHSHLLDYYYTAGADGRRLHGLNCGVFWDATPDFASSSAHLWWRGLCYLHGAENGSYDLETISMERLRALYG